MKTRAYLLLSLVAAVAVVCTVQGAPAEKPSDSAPSYLYFANEDKSPLITDAYPLHKAVAYYDLQGVKAAIAKGANPNLAVQQDGFRLKGTYTPMRVAKESFKACGATCTYVPDILADIIIELLCAGANPSERPMNPWDKESTPLTGLTVKANYRLIYALLTAGASTAGASTDSHCGGPRGKDDISSAMSLAVLAAFGVDVRPKDPMYYYSKDLWNSNCAKPAKLLNFSSPDFQTNPEFDAVHDICFSVCTIRKQGLTTSEASELREGRVSPSLAAKLDLSNNPVHFHKTTLREVNTELAQTAAALKACPAIAKRNSGK